MGRWQDFFPSCSGDTTVKMCMRIGLVALATVALCGCVKQSQDGAATVFSYEWWAPVGLTLGGLAAAPVGWLLRDKSSYFGWGLLVVGVIGGLGVGPSMFADHITVDDQGFVSRTGLVGLATTHTIKFAELSRVRLTFEETRGRRGRKTTNYYLVCERKDGTSAKVPLSNSIAEKAAPMILQSIKDKNVPIVDELPPG